MKISLDSRISKNDGFFVNDMEIRLFSRIIFHFLFILIRMSKAIHSIITQHKKGRIFMLNDIEMLNFIRKNAQMGCQGIEEITPYAKEEKFRKALETQQEEYKTIFEEADRLLHERNEKPEDVSAMAKLSSKTMTMMQTMKDPSVEHLAEMMYQGSAMGITKITRHQKDYAGTNPKICDLAKRLLKTEERNMEEMRTFL